MRTLPNSKIGELAMNTVTRLTIVLLFLAGAARGQSTQETTPAGELLTIERANALALEHNRSLRIAQLEAQKADDQVAAVRTRRLPQTKFSVLGSQLLSEVSFEFEKGVFGDFPSTGPIPAEDTRITTPRRPNFYVVGTVSQPLSQLYEINLNIQQGKLARQVREEDLQEQRQAVVHRIRSLYYAAQEAETTLAASRDSIAFYRELENLTGRLLDEQAVLKSDLLDARARLVKEEYDALTTENRLAQLKEQLNLEMGRDIRQPFALAPVADAAAWETDLSAAHQAALERRPELREARLKVRMAEQERKIKRAEYIPDVSLTFNYLSPFNIEVLPKNIASIGVQLSWEPWDWGRKKREVQEKSRSIEQAELSVREAESRVLHDVSQSLRKLREARASIPVADAARETAREKLRMVTHRFAERAALYKDVLQAQMEAAQASRSHQQAVLAFWSARADFEKAIGEGI
jgi:outer membrane protein TolC